MLKTAIALMTDMQFVRKRIVEQIAYIKESNTKTYYSEERKREIIDSATDRLKYFNHLALIQLTHDIDTK